jgi:uncharacterized repeat protein (TIGR03803 family)
MRSFALCLGLIGGLAVTATQASAQANDYKVEQEFHGGQGGGTPMGGLVSVGNTLYGATVFGGTGHCQVYAAKGCGAVYSYNPATRARQIVYSFQGKRDGAYPVASLTNVGGVLYGTTTRGGDEKTCTGGCGTVFSLDPGTGAEHVLYTFHSADGSYPASSLLAVGHTLIGTTTNGGATSCGGNCGTVFSVNTKTGVEQILHFFQGGADGNNPVAGLINVNGTLYGSTPYGGTAAACGSIGCGTIYKLDPATSTESVVYAFQNLENPQGGLINVNGILYGTYINGVYSFNPATGAEQTAYTFQGGNDGDIALGDLVNVGGTLYGTTQFGGSSFSYGTVFAFNPSSGAEQVVHAFLAGRDGALPETGLTALGGKLYGTTVYGGNKSFLCFDTACGTLFSFRP